MHFLQPKDVDAVAEIIKSDISGLLKLLIPHYAELQKRNTAILQRQKTDPNNLDNLIIGFAAAHVALARVNDQKKFITEKNNN